MFSDLYNAKASANMKRSRDADDDTTLIQRRRETVVGRVLRGMVDTLNSNGIVDEWEDELARAERVLIETMDIVQLDSDADPVDGDACSITVLWEEVGDDDWYYELEFELVYDEEDGWNITESGWNQ
jgi:hypothetical protein